MHANIINYAMAYWAQRMAINTHIHTAVHVWVCVILTQCVLKAGGGLDRKLEIK